MALAIYRLLSALALPGVLAYFLWRSRAEPAYRAHWHERLGRVAKCPDRPIWIHAASVGEMTLAIAVVRALQGITSAPLLITTMTPTGRAAATKTLGDEVAVHYVPLDTRHATRTAVARIRPRSVIIIETELWPNLIDALACAAVPVAVLNATLSARSAAQYERVLVRALIRRTLSHIDLIGAASSADHERFDRIGARRNTLRTLGQLKYDLGGSAASQAVMPDLPGPPGRPVIVAGSTHENEEARWLSILSDIKTVVPDVLLILAPRHPQRFAHVADLLTASRFTWARFTEHGADAGIDIWLIDTLGALNALYRRADIAFVGGTLVPGIGGHNVIEPAAAGCVVVTGAHGKDWREIMQPWVHAGHALIAADETEISRVIIDWLSNRTRLRAAGQANAQQVQSARGALDASVTALRVGGFLDP